MNILFQSKSDLYNPKGGDTIQMEKLAEEIKKLGHSVDINLSINADLSNYDLVNIFNINHIVEFYLQFKNAKRQNKKVVISAIYHSMRDIERWEKLNSYGYRKVLNYLGITNQYARDYFKNFYKIIFEKKYEKLLPLINQMVIGTKKQQKEVITDCDMVFVQTLNEVEDIKSELLIDDFKFRQVVNGVDTKYFNLDFKEIKDRFNLGRYILEVGRIEPRKNQIMVINAFEKLTNEGKIDNNISLVFAGDRNLHHQLYFSEFKEKIKNNAKIKYLGYLPHIDIQHLMTGAMLHVYPSWFETTGLLNIEALWAGTKVVTSGKRAKEYVKDYGQYCDPSSVNSIADAILRSLTSNVNFDEVKEYIQNNFTWEIAAKQCVSYYKEILYGNAN